MTSIFIATVISVSTSSDHFTILSDRFRIFPRQNESDFEQSALLMPRTESTCERPAPLASCGIETGFRNGNPISDQWIPFQGLLKILLITARPPLLEILAKQKIGFRRRKGTEPRMVFSVKIPSSRQGGGKMYAVTLQRPKRSCDGRFGEGLVSGIFYKGRGRMTTQWEIFKGMADLLRTSSPGSVEGKGDVTKNEWASLVGNRNMGGEICTCRHCPISYTKCTRIGNTDHLSKRRTSCETCWEMCWARRLHSRLSRFCELALKIRTLSP